ncbi:hypothetical protein SMAC4_13591 [Sordaria macrospora]|nr:hypothetical protein SMAC4_13591 [Sordaria macrospora]
MKDNGHLTTTRLMKYWTSFTVWRPFSSMASISSPVGDQCLI